MTTRKLPFGFHIGIGGNANGLKTNYADRLNAAGISFCVVAADAMPFDFQEIAKNSATEHFVVFRRSVAHNGQSPPSGDVNVPNYSKTPLLAAQEHTTWMLNHLPPELNKDITWVTDINEPRHSEVDHPGINEWLASYSIEAAKICWARGNKYVALNFAGGNHPLWEDAGIKMKELYQLAEDNPHRLMIGTHEYSFYKSDILTGDGFLVGRIRKQLLDQMPNVPVIVTEFGWEESDVPDTQTALADYQSVANLYYNHPGVKAAATWYLGQWAGNIANKVQQFIAPLADLTLTTEIEMPEDEMCNCTAITDVRTISLWIPPYGNMTDQELTQAYAWARYGFPDNNNVVTPGNHMLCPSHIDALRIHTQGLPGSILGIAYSNKIGSGVTVAWLQQNCPCVFEDDKQVVFLGTQQSTFSFTHAPVITR